MPDNMEQNTPSTTCPFCGATSSNHMNCDSCGSFWIQFAEKENVRTLIEQAQEYENSGLEQTLEKYCELLRSGSSLDFVLSISHGSMETFILITPNHLDLKGNSTGKNCTGFKARIRSHFFHFDAYDRARFENSSSYFVLKEETCTLGRIYDYDHETKTVHYYTVDFGFDVKGAVQVLMQISQEVLRCSPSLFVYEIGLMNKNCFIGQSSLQSFYNNSMFGDSCLMRSEQSVRFNNQGTIIRAKGDGEYFFKNLINKDKANHELVKTSKLRDSHAVWAAVEDYLNKTKDKSRSRLQLDFIGPTGIVLLTLSTRDKNKYSIRIDSPDNVIEFQKSLINSPAALRIHAAYSRMENIGDKVSFPMERDIILNLIDDYDAPFIRYLWANFRFQPKEIYNTIMAILSMGYGIDPCRITIRERKGKGFSLNSVNKSKEKVDLIQWLGLIGLLLLAAFSIWISL